MSNAEQDTGQKEQDKQEQEQSEWDSLKDPFDVRNVENPTQDDKSYEAWLRSNANPDQLDINGNPTGAVTPEKPFDTKDIENPTQDDLSYEAWLKSNANPAFETDRDGNPNRAYEAPKAAEAVTEEAAAEQDGGAAVEEEDSVEFDPTKSRWSQMSEDDKYDLLHKYPRQEGEKTNAWGKRIEAAEGVRIFGLETANKDAGTEAPAEEPAVEETPAEEPAAEPESAEQPAEEPAAEEAPAEEPATEETSAEEPAVESDTENQKATEETPAAEEEPAAAPEAEETEEGQEDDEKLKNELLSQLGGGEMAAWVESDKKLTRGDLGGMDVAGLQKLVDEYNGLHAENMTAEDIPESGNEDASMLGASVEAAPAQPAPEVVVEQVKAGETQEEAVADKKAAEPKAPETAEKAEVKTVAEQIEKMNKYIDSIREYRVQSEAWKQMEKILKNCSESVQDTVEYARAKKSLASQEATLKGYREELRGMPLFTLPWGEARSRKNSLKSLIKSSEASIVLAGERVDRLKAGLPESLTDEEQEQVEDFAKMDARMDRINADLHIRADLGAIGMREGWIKAQRVAMEQEGGKNSPSKEKREAFIKKTQGEIDDIRKRISDYQEAHPDFVLHPDLEYTNPTYEQLVGEGIDETPDVAVEEGSSEDEGEDPTTIEGGENNESTPLEKAQARLDAIRAELRDRYRMYTSDETPDSEKAMDEVGDYLKLVDEETDAGRDVAYEKGAEVLDKSLLADWRKEVDGDKHNVLLMINCNNAIDIIKTINMGNIDLARIKAGAFMLSGEDLKTHLLDLIGKYGGDEGKALADELRASGDQAGSAEA